MSKKRCKQKGQIARLYYPGLLECYKCQCMVKIAVDDQKKENYCENSCCPFSFVRIPNSSW